LRKEILNGKSVLIVYLTKDYDCPFLRIIFGRMLKKDFFRNPRIFFKFELFYEFLYIFFHKVSWNFGICHQKHYLLEENMLIQNQMLSKFHKKTSYLLKTCRKKTFKTTKYLQSELYASSVLLEQPKMLHFLMIY
jgi:hypothetical protein